MTFDDVKQLMTKFCLNGMLYYPISYNNIRYMNIVFADFRCLNGSWYIKFYTNNMDIAFDKDDAEQMIRIKVKEIKEYNSVQKNREIERDFV